MQEDQSGSEGQGPEYVGPWSPSGREADTSAEAGGANSPSPDAEPGQPGETAPLVIPPGASPAGQPGGYGQAGGYGQGGYAHPVPFGQEAGRGQAEGYGGYGAGGYGPPADYIQQGPPPNRGRARGLMVYVLVAVLAAWIGAASVAALYRPSGQSPSANTGLNPNTGNGINPGNGFGQGNGSGANSGTGVNNAQEQRVADAVEPGVVDITSRLQYVGGTAQATGMVISPSGLVLTNNHVIQSTTGLTATLVSSGHRYKARWLGYDRSDDVALIQLIGASGLRTVPLGDSSTVKLGDDVVAIGNAQGVGGRPAVVSGNVTQLNQTITASDDLGGTETLHGMLQTNAQIVEGDSGGPLANASGKVIGMDTAASSGSFGNNQSTDVGFAIPINRALTIARQIESGKGSSTIKIGATGFIGVLVPSQRASSATSPSQQRQLQLGQGNSGTGRPSSGQACLPNDQNAGVPNTIAPVSSGTLVLGDLCATPADRAGITAGDVITAVNGRAVSSPNSLTDVLASYRPGTTVAVTWVDTAGQRHVSNLNLIQAPPL